jgi:hypothetical protein
MRIEWIFLVPAIQFVVAGCYALYQWAQGKD